MKIRTALAALGAAALLGVSLPAATPLMPVDEIRPGMEGVGRTVFAGTDLKDFKVHILGVLRNIQGPKRDLILAKLEGAGLAESGVAQGMSGSPVYVDGRLIKGSTSDFVPAKEFFHVAPADADVVPSETRSEAAITGAATDRRARGEIIAGILDHGGWLG